MNDYKLDEYLKKNPEAKKVAEITKPHKVLEFNIPIVVYYVDIASGGHRSVFSLFKNDVFLCNSIMFPCSVSKEDQYTIGKEMIDELLNSSDFFELDKELNGMAACKEYENVYKRCDDCPLYISNECIGATYSIPSHKNFWNISKKWDGHYGEGSKAYINYKTSKMIGHINDYMWACGESIESIKEILEYATSHPNNKHLDLFKSEEAYAGKN